MRGLDLRLGSRVRTARSLATHPGVIAEYLFSRLRGSYSTRRYCNLWAEVANLRPERIVEIGVFRGNTGRRLISLALEHVSAVDYWGFDLFAEGSTAEQLSAEVDGGTPPLSINAVFERLQRPGATIHLVPGDTRYTLARTDVPPADLVFIDGGHSYDTVASDWKNAQEFLHPRSVVYFDDYTNDVGVRHGYGVKRLVDELNSSVWLVERFSPTDRYVRPYGVVEHSLVRVSSRSSPLG